MSVLVGLLVALAVGVVGGVRGRPLQAWAARDAAHTGPGKAGTTSTDLSAVLLATAAQLRAGAGPTDAWDRAIGGWSGGSVPTEGALLAATVRTGSRGIQAARSGVGERQRVRAVVAAARLSDELGAPLADVLDRIASAVAADAEAEGERRAALAGPRATARVLAWLPLLGLLLGGLLGADPVGVVLSGGPGTAAAVLGGVLLLLGRWWTATLLRRAARP